MLIDVAIPTYRRPAALAVTLATLVGQTFDHFRVIISDQTETARTFEAPEAAAVIRVLRAHGREVLPTRHLPRRGMAEHRQFLLELSTAPYVLFLDDDVILEADAIARMMQAMQREACGFVGSAVIGLSFIDDVREEEQSIEFWQGRVKPESVSHDSAAWKRHRLHNAANLYHLQQRLNVPKRDARVYHVAWTGGAVLYHRAKLIDAGGFSFWRQLPQEHSGEDVLAQMRVMERFGGCGLFPSGVYHQELPTTIPNRDVDAPRLETLLRNSGTSATQGAAP